MSKYTNGFDLLARPYRLLEFLALGKALEEARFVHLPALQQCARVLLLGDGDGRLLARLLRTSETLRVDSVELSSGMIEQAKGRLSLAEQARVCFRNEDALAARYSPFTYDAVVTAFFLDCFSTEIVRGLMGRVLPALRPGAFWLHVDFALPDHGWRRIRAQAWLGLLYLFFGACTDISARCLPGSEDLLEPAGFRRIATTTMQAGLLRSVLFRLDQRTHASKPAHPGLEHSHDASGEG